MTAITDATLVIETLIGHSMSGAALTRIANRFVTVDPHSLADFAIPGSPTNEEKAKLVLDTFKTWGVQVVRGDGEAEEEASVRAQIAAAGDAAAVDFT